jgi:hypothetical protein
MGLEQPGKETPCAAFSREQMLPQVPVAKEVLRQYNAEDLAEMILGEDA